MVEATVLTAASWPKGDSQGVSEKAYTVQEACVLLQLDMIERPRKREERSTIRQIDYPR